MICFLIDGQLPPRLAQLLTARGFGAEHINRVGLGAATDKAIWQYAVRTRATLLTKDEDFVALAGKELIGPQVVWLRIGNISNDALWRVLDPLLEEIVQSLKAGERIVEVT